MPKEVFEGKCPICNKEFYSLSKAQLDYWLGVHSYTHKTRKGYKNLEKEKAKENKAEAKK